MEKQFKFSLQKLLDIRLQQEENSMLSFQKAQLASMVAEEKLNSLQESYNKYSVESYEESVIHKKITRIYLSALTKHIEAAEEDAKEKEKALYQCREDLIHKQVDRKTIEILKDKKYSQYLLEESQKEQKANDEFALYGYIKQTAEGR